ncbi:hypothetical protein IscW_ISCW023057 [Ixodes scapularis]|uniref:Uncharacterized protein n=1 Tax=Ixodes scapularis TaxID=6945 RepID=B7QHD0_IXOSC|nr:hypothetical protein IscW_ISCW023057 [Ixodes scapularis]|eukprot:XP_002414587.1 hypothetical protein IscW_ISCW023057 [Ixodes scapularis]
MGFFFFSCNFASIAFRSGQTIHDCVQGQACGDIELAGKMYCFLCLGIDIISYTYVLQVHLWLSAFLPWIVPLESYPNKIAYWYFFFIFFLKAESLGWLATAARRNIERSVHNK